ncbi:dual specificity protein phosphatase 1-like [Hydractinia symbiolongicarpus]|uniref:dual specificity protein phosphatase 1-like n=1 Tax=Hydractinia symbiolongicarpus TaxID=13093 RepID=UPI00254FF65E|nr:dual specificity protein phosphatase 1-like [Hydractinia symbiolongicarpus]
MKMLAKRVCLAVDSQIIAESSDKSRILLDVREPSSYGKSHIKTSVNLLTSNLILRRLQRGSLTIKSLMPESVVTELETDMYRDTIVIYDESSTTDNESRRISVIGSALKKDFPKMNIFFLDGGFNDFCETYPIHCEFDYPVDIPNPFQISIGSQLAVDPTDKIDGTPDDDACPVAILPFVYLGNAYHSSQKELLKKLGITAILNVSRVCPVLFPNSFEYKTISIGDNATENISCHFDESIKFIDDVKSKNGKVLVHCRAGISRSATICIAYLMRKCGYTLDEAYDFTKKKRSNISPNFNFLGQLLTLESEVLSAKKLEVKSAVTNSALSLSIEPKRVPLTSGIVTNSIFTYSPKTCINFFGFSSPSNLSPSTYRVLLTPT